MAETYILVGLDPLRMRKFLSFNATVITIYLRGLLTDTVRFRNLVCSPQASGFNISSVSCQAHDTGTRSRCGHSTHIS